MAARRATWASTLKFADNKEKFAKLQMNELRNGRLAMLGFSGMIHTTFVTGSRSGRRRRRSSRRPKSVGTC